MNPVLSVRNLTVHYPGKPGVCAVDGVDLELAAGEVVGLIGESGSGKSSVASAILGILDTPRVSADAMLLGEHDILSLNERQYRQLRGRDISMVFQEPQTALDPVFTVGSQIQAVLKRHGKATVSEPGKAAERVLEGMNLGDIPGLLRSYPHQLSGGMRQRILIAMAMACRPAVLLADEPTTALDVTTQALVLDSLVRMGREHDTAILFITHDLAVAATICQRIVVMKDGRFVETAPTSSLLYQPSHPYTRHLLDCIPKPGRPVRDVIRSDDDPGEPILALVNRRVSHPVRVRGKRQRLVAVRDATLDIRRGEIHALVGESGSGKSTLAQSLLGLKPADSGSMSLNGQQVSGRKSSEWSRVRRHVQLVFQDPRASLSPRRTVGQSLMEPLDHFKIDTPAGRRSRIESVLERVGLETATTSRFPHELSGGQRQRVALARAMISEPDLIVADEPLSSLDVSVQSKIIDLLLELRDQAGFGLLIVSHDLAVVRQMADRVSVMYLGRIVESGPARSLLNAPAHPYTRTLLEAVPQPGQARRETFTDPERLAIEPPSLLTPPPGCVFHTRCPEVLNRCTQADPPEYTLDSASEVYDSHKVRCLLYENHQ
ncbi:MAG TPA: ABC transporter ATP-binding protein [Xanthomonadales bacterium]|nr:ABC transporter ATP-binding protein [Xanthomonadales bacterium]